MILPSDDDPTFADDDRAMLASAAHAVNAVALGLPPNTPREAVRRLVAIADLTSGHDTSPTHRLHAIATGQDR